MYINKNRNNYQKDFRLCIFLGDQFKTLEEAQAGVAVYKSLQSHCSVGIKMKQNKQLRVSVQAI